MSLRAEDGRFSLRKAGAERILRLAPSPSLRVVVDDDAGAYVRQGKNVIAKTVVAMDETLRPGDDAVVVDTKDHFAGIARVLLTSREFKQVKRGVAARTMEGLVAQKP
jgi:predicted RNA-binding protein (TIGR00451 family)